jgi:hypothetical protein
MFHQGRWETVPAYVHQAVLLDVFYCVAMNATLATATKPGAWNYKHLFAALGIAAVLQSIFLPCLCDIGTAKSVFAFCFDTLILLRIGAAWHMSETGGGWKFYAWLIWKSPLWIEGVAYVVFGDV